MIKKRFNLKPIHPNSISYSLVRNIFICTILLIWSTQLVVAQKYDWAGGVRMGTEFGASLTPRIAKKATLEGIAQYSHLYHSSRIALLFRQHQGFLGKRFNIFIGGGPGWAWYHEKDQELKDENSANVVAIFGIEGTIGRLNISWDYKPVYSFTGPRTFFSESALSLRYVIIKRKWQPFKKKKEPFWERIF